MQLVILLLLVVALGFLVLGVIGASSPLIVASIVTSIVAGLLLFRSRRQRASEPSVPSADAGTVSEPTGDTRDASGAAEAAGVAGASRAGEAVPASEIIAAQRAAEVIEVIEVVEEPPAASTEAPLRAHGGDIVVVIDGHPRYHAQRCRYLLGRASETVPLRQAVEDGFTPCSMCDPDVVLAAAPTPTSTD